MSAIELSAVDVSEWGFRVSLPQDWARVAPDTSRWEVLRVLAPPAARPFFTVNKWGLLPNMDLDEYERRGTDSLGPAQDIHSSRTTIGGLPAFRTDYTGTHSMTADVMLSIRAYGLIQPPVGWVFRFGTDDLTRDAAVFDAIAETIQVN